MSTQIPAPRKGTGDRQYESKGSENALWPDASDVSEQLPQECGILHAAFGHTAGQRDNAPIFQPEAFDVLHDPLGIKGDGQHLPLDHLGAAWSKRSDRAADVEVIATFQNPTCGRWANQILYGSAGVDTDDQFRKIFFRRNIAMIPECRRASRDPKRKDQGKPRCGKWCKGPHLTPLIMRRPLLRRRGAFISTYSSFGLGSRNESRSMSQTPPSTGALRVSGLAQNAATPFTIVPDQRTLEAMAETLDLTGLRKVRFEGQVAAHGARDWLLTAQLGATVTQPCAVTLVPVTTRIDVPVRRLFLRDYEEVDTPEAEMPEDDEVERLGVWIDPEAVLIEALSLAVPDFPRADGAELGQIVLTEPGVAPLTDEAARPFAGLADLKSKLEGDKNN